MIKEYEYLHGVVFTRLCSVLNTEVSIRPYTLNNYSAYIINNKAGLYIKYSGKRLSPWRFSFRKAHQDEIKKMQVELGEVFIALVCNLDGVAVLNYKEFKSILDETHNDNEWVCIKRQKNGMYSISASDGKLEFKVSKTSCPNKIVSFLGH